MSEKQVEKAPNPDGESFKADIPTSERVQKINEGLKEIQKEIGWACTENVFLILGIATICGFITYFGYVLGRDLYYYDTFNDKWTWQMIYFTTARVIIVSGFFYLVFFFFNLLKNFIFSYQRNRHRKFVINSLSNLIVAGQNVANLDMNDIYKTILEIITKFDDTGLYSKDSELESLPISRVLELLLKLVEKK